MTTCGGAAVIGKPPLHSACVPPPPRLGTRSTLPMAIVLPSSRSVKRPSCAREVGRLGLQVLCSGTQVLLARQQARAAIGMSIQQRQVPPAHTSCPSTAKVFDMQAQSCHYASQAWRHRKQRSARACPPAARCQTPRCRWASPQRCARCTWRLQRRQQACMGQARISRRTAQKHSQHQSLCARASCELHQGLHRLSDRPQLQGLDGQERNKQRNKQRSQQRLVRGSSSHRSWQTWPSSSPWSWGPPPPPAWSPRTPPQLQQEMGEKSEEGR